MNGEQGASPAACEFYVVARACLLRMMPVLLLAVVVLVEDGVSGPVGWGVGPSLKVYGTPWNGGDAGGAKAFRDRARRARGE